MYTFGNVALLQHFRWS